MGSSTADKHHSTHKHHSTKRKDPPADLAAPNPKKPVASDHKSGQAKPSADAQQALRERHRHAVSALYTAYEQLSSASASADDHAAAFDVLLEGAKGKLQFSRSADPPLWPHPHAAWPFHSSSCLWRSVNFTPTAAEQIPHVSAHCSSKLHFTPCQCVSTWCWVMVLQAAHVLRGWPPG